MFLPLFPSCTVYVYLYLYYGRPQKNRRRPRTQTPPSDASIINYKSRYQCNDVAIPPCRTPNKLRPMQCPRLLTQTAIPKSQSNKTKQKGSLSKDVYTQLLLMLSFYTLSGLECKQTAASLAHGPDTERREEQTDRDAHGDLDHASSHVEHNVLQVVGLSHWYRHGTIDYLCRVGDLVGRAKATQDAAS